MLLTQAHYTTANGFLKGPYVTAVAQRVLNASVKLQGSGGSESGTFTGSATILKVGTEVVYTGGKWTPTTKQFTVLVTCKHSLYTLGNGGVLPDTDETPNTARWDQDLVANFKKAKIYYSNAGDNDFGTELTRTANIDHVVPIFEENIGAATKMLVLDGSKSSDGNAFVLLNLTGTTTPDNNGIVNGTGGLSPAVPASGWAYDVMILLSKDPDLYTFANTPGNCDYQAGISQKDLVAALSAQYPAFNNYKALVPVLSRDRVQLAQTGVGTVSDQLQPKGAKEKDPKITLPALPKSDAQNGRLQYKLSTPDAAVETANFYDQLPGSSGPLILTNTHGFILGCDSGNNSTNSGDSGGGIFAFKKNNTALLGTAVLAGVTTGSGSATAAEDAPKMWDFDNNVVTSLGLYYGKLFNLRYQNV
jgi:hypothetical protein